MTTGEKNREKGVPLLLKNPLEKFKGASFSGSVFNLSCTIIGAGIMSLPATFKVLGVVPGIALILFTVFLTDMSIEMLLRFSRPSGCGSYSEVMGDTFGVVGKMALQIIVVVNNIGVVIVYLIIIEDVFSGSTSNGVHHAGVLEGWFGAHWWTGRSFVLAFLTLTFFIPSICFKRIDSLRYTSTISVLLAVVFLAVVASVSVYKIVEGSVLRPRWFPEITNFGSFWNFFTVVPVIVCACVCHYNVHTIQNELAEEPQMQAVVGTSLALCASVYVTTGLFGYLLFGESTLPDMLSNFDNDLGIPYGYLLNDIIRVSYGGHIILIFPIVFHPLRLSFDGIFFSSSRPLASDNTRFAVISLLLVFIGLVGALYIPNIWVVFEFVGATAGFLMAFILPAAITLKDRHGIATGKDKLAAIFMILLGIFANAIAICSSAYSLVR
uniref:Amino acid transporter transmembrane domain-containing protein n=1 Tax=Kalanchoe fedtschenkoi TaxID=63787 RepID=A0A7N0TTT4_KALFE